jgi:agmatine deiminase
MKTPGQLGYRMPAEWEPHEATWLAWPHNRTDWPGKLSAIYWVYADIARKLTPSEPVHILVNSAPHQTKAESILRRSDVDMTRIHFHRIPTDRAWMRDFGPLFITRDRGRERLAVAAFRFNGWALYGGWSRDDAVKGKLARGAGLPLFRARRGRRDIVLEGGGIDVNGRGSLLTTEECLLDQSRQVRNPGTSREDTEKILRSHLGVNHIIWLRRGIAGDDTHGHVDDFCRFVKPGRVVLSHENKRRDVNYVPLHENWERLHNLRLPSGRKLEVVPLPMPSPLRFQGMRLPASYANFYIANKVVLVPTFNDPRDPLALGIIADQFPDRQVVGVHSIDLVWGLGGIHCITMQQPRVPAHKPAT